MSLQAPNREVSQVPARTTDFGQQSIRGLVRVLALLYTLLIVYGSLYPFSGWSHASSPLFSFLTAPIPDHLSRPDVLTNVFAYIPLGVLLVTGFRLRSGAMSVVMATTLGAMLSFTMESVQMFLPARISSNIDLSTNIAGTLIGAILALVVRQDTIFRVNLRRTREEWFEPGLATDIALFAVALWIGSQLCPFVPSMDVSSVREGLAPLRMLLSPASFVPAKCASYGFNIAGLGLLIMIVGRRRVRLTYLGLAGLVLCLKPTIVTRQLSPESLCGLAFAAVMLLIAPRTKPAQTLLAMFYILSGFAAAELYGVAGGGLHPFNWIPFAVQLDETVSGMQSILENLWPFVALAALSILGFGRKRSPMVYLGGVLVFLVLSLEWMQTGIEGRYGNITTVMTAAVGWFFPWLFFLALQPASAERSSSTRRRRSRSSEWHTDETSAPEINPT
jgi:VanZ family protein